MTLTVQRSGSNKPAARLGWRMLPVVAGLIWGGCAGSAASSGASAKSGAESLYEQGLEDLEDGLFPEALKTFNEVKTRHPYTRFAALSDLRIADTHFERGKFVEAIDAYRAFLKLHPSHEQAPYAMLRIGDAYHDQVPEDWWFLPPSAEKDQGNTRMAIGAYKDMIARYPGNEMSKKAQEGLDACRTKLADHEIYVARFYFKRDDFRAALTRAEGLLGAYPGLGHDLEALWIAGRSHVELGEIEPARAALQRLVETFPDTAEATEAESVLRQLGTTADEDKHG